MCLLYLLSRFPSDTAFATSFARRMVIASQLPYLLSRFPSDTAFATSFARRMVIASQLPYYHKIHLYVERKCYIVLLMKNSGKKIAHAGVIAALYIILTYSLQFLASGPIQIRFSEALCVLPIFTPAAIPGVAIGCLLSNIFMGNAFYDIIFGTIATLIGAIGTRLLRKHPVWALFPPILSNSVIIPLILRYVYGSSQIFPLLIIGVFVGEFLSVGILGFLLYHLLKKYPNLFS